MKISIIIIYLLTKVNSGSLRMADVDLQIKVYILKIIKIRNKSKLFVSG